MTGVTEGSTVAGPVLSFLDRHAADEVWLLPGGDDARDRLLAREVATRRPDVRLRPLPSDVALSDAATWPAPADVTLMGGDVADTLDLAAALMRSGRSFQIAQLVAGGFPGEPLFALRGFRGEAPPSCVVREPGMAYGAVMSRDYAAPAPGTAGPGARPADVARRVGLIGEHPLLARQIETAAAVAPSPYPILITGETGSGKGVMARFVHELSDRAARPFAAVNCAALPEQLVESILFGHVRGAFTGATSDHAGKFAQADGGTLFLDEIGELPPALQPKLLKVLEDGLVEPVGAGRARKVDVRVVAATNRDLRAGVAAGSFREDLYYRLSFATVLMPPLRERRSDIHRIALHLLDRFNRRLQRPKQFALDALRSLEQAEWRGNVRDLENVIGRSALFARDDVIRAGDLLYEPAPASPSSPPAPLPELREGFSLEDHLRDVRRQLVERALAQTDGRQGAAARLLGVSPQALSQYLRARGA